jgi:adenosine deaminase
MDDAALVNELVNRQVPLTVCPLSNVKLGVFARLEEHNLRRMLQSGLCVTVNSDDPAYFGGYIAENLLAAQQALQLTASEVYCLTRNAMLAAFLPDAQRQVLLDKAAAVYDQHCASTRPG